MPLDALYQVGLLAATAIAAFAISYVVGYLIADRSTLSSAAAGPSAEGIARSSGQDSPHDPRELEPRFG